MTNYLAPMHEVNLLYAKPFLKKSISNNKIINTSFLETSLTSIYLVTATIVDVIRYQQTRFVALHNFDFKYNYTIKKTILSLTPHQA